MIPQEEVDAMKARVKANKGNIWRGFISFNEHDSEKIGTPENGVYPKSRTLLEVYIITGVFFCRI